MEDTSSDLSYVEPPTTLGPAPENPSNHVALPDGALDAGCYIEGPQTPAQTALLHSWCVEWAEAGHGFCYVHPRGPETRELMARLPEDRLEDVVWIDARRKRLAEHLDVPPAKRVCIDPFTIPGHDDAFAIDPVTARVDAYMDAYAESPYHNRNVERILDVVLPPLISTDDLEVSDVTNALTKANLGTPEALLALEPFADSQRADREITAAHARDPTDFLAAKHALTNPQDPYPSNPLRGEPTYDIASALANNRIVLVTGTLPQSVRNGGSEIDLYVTQLLVCSLLCRLWEAAQTTDATGTYPLVVDGFDELAVGEATLFQNVLAHTNGTPLAPVLCGRPIDDFEDPLKLALADHVGTEVTVVDGGDVDLSSVMKTGSLNAAEWYLEREQNSGVAPEGRCWLRTGTDGLLAGTEALEREMQPALLPEMPRGRHSKGPLATAITRSVERHGTIPAWLTDEMLAETRAEYEDEG